MEPIKPASPGAISREEFSRLSGHVIGLTNAVRALIEAAPDRDAALATIERCFATEEAMGQSFEYIDAWQREGIDHCLDELKTPIPIDTSLDPDPGGRIAKAQQAYRERQDALHAGVMKQLLRPRQPDEPASGEQPPDSP